MKEFNLELNVFEKKQGNLTRVTAFSKKRINVVKLFKPYEDSGKKIKEFFWKPGFVTASLVQK